MLKKPGDCGYICHYNGKRVDVYAPTLSVAKRLAVAHFKPPKSHAHMVSVCLAEGPDGGQKETVLT